MSQRAPAGSWEHRDKPLGSIQGSKFLENELSLHTFQKELYSTGFLLLTQDCSRQTQHLSLFSIATCLPVILKLSSKEQKFIWSNKIIKLY